MTIRSSSSSGIPYGNNAARPASPSVGQPYFNGEVSRLELYTETGWQNIVGETPSVLSYTGSVLESNTSNELVISGTNFISGAGAFLVGSNGAEVQSSTTIVNSITQITATFGALSPLYEPYDIKVVNPSNLYGLLNDAVYVNNSPVWSTPSGLLGSFSANSPLSVQVAATDQESNPITYFISAGSLPGGLSLNSSTGVISGTPAIVSSDTTYTFTVTASDSSNTVVSRSFSITIIAVSVVTGGTLSSDSTYYYRKFTSTNNLIVQGKSISCDYLMVGGGASGGTSGGGGGGAGGLIIATTTLSSGTYNVSIGGGAAPSFSNGTNTEFNGKIALGGGGGASMAGPSPGNSGGSGGGGQRNTTNNDNAVGSPGGSGLQPASASGGYGNNGGSGRDASGSTAAGGGGGGAGAAGSNSPGGAQGGAGGIGFYNAVINTMGAATSSGQLSSGNYYFAGGGGGGCGSNYTSSTIAAGLGGGGFGAKGMTSSGDTTAVGGSATANTGGGGGGGGSFPGAGNDGGSGGSGIVIIRYTKASVGG